MGIPHLTTHLAPHSTLTTLPCPLPSYPHHPPSQPPKTLNLIIDGPSFAYTIYYRIVNCKPDGLDALGSVPSYEEIGGAVVWWLGEVERGGGGIQKIYFDGLLPPQKASIRITRLNNQISQLFSSHSKHQKGFQTLTKTTAINPSILAPKSSRPNSFSLPPPPFFIPAIVECLKTSIYAPITTIVPGEADACCAREAREHGGIILSNDSDLLIYDLGHDGVVGSLHDLTILETESGDETTSSTHRVVQTTTLNPRSIARKLGLEDLQTLAYFLKTSDCSFQQAIKQAKSTNPSTTEKQEFLSEYTTSPSVSEQRHCHPSTLDHLHAHPLDPDPRLSELILQSHLPSPTIYLPIMIEDPTRSSAFAISSPLRRFAYSCCLIPYGLQGKEIIEYVRRAQKVLPTTITIFSENEICEYATYICNQLQQIKQTFSAFPLTLMWRVYSLADVYKWYINTSRAPAQREEMSSVLSGNHARGVSWGDIHLTAQIEATLYSLRMTKQVLEFTSSMMVESIELGTSLLNLLTALTDQLKDLPPLAALMPSRGELMELTAEIDMEGLLDPLAGILQDEIGRGGDGGSGGGGNRGGGDDDNNGKSRVSKNDGVEKRRKKRKKKAGRAI